MYHARPTRHVSSNGDSFHVKTWMKALDSQCWYKDLLNDRGQQNGNKLRTYRLLVPEYYANLDHVVVY